MTPRGTSLQDTILVNLNLVLSGEVALVNALQLFLQMGFHLDRPFSKNICGCVRDVALFIISHDRTDSIKPSLQGINCLPEFLYSQYLFSAVAAVKIARLHLIVVILTFFWSFGINAGGRTYREVRYFFKRGEKVCYGIIAEMYESESR